METLIKSFSWSYIFLPNERFQFYHTDISMVREMYSTEQEKTVDVIKLGFTDELYDLNVNLSSCMKGEGHELYKYSLQVESPSK